MNISPQWMLTLKTLALVLPVGIWLPGYAPVLKQSTLQAPSLVVTELQPSTGIGSHPTVPVVAADIPAAQQWQDYVQADLLPFWTVPDALGDPVGNFPSVRCNDGILVNVADPCAELQNHDWLLTGDQSVVALSRQIYTYGVAFQLTGEPQYLAYAKAGVDYLRANALDRSQGGAYSWWSAEAQTWVPALAYRNPQEQAYALMGIGYYYYLTRDPAVLQDILELKDFIFETYYNPELGLLQWQLQDSGDNRALDRQLAAQLDQISAYMLLLTPILSEPEKTEWTRDMVGLSKSILENFYLAEENMFSLSTLSHNGQGPLATELNFGTTIKAMWLMRMIGLLGDEPSLVDFAVTHAPNVLERAFMPEVGAWADGVRPDGTLNRDASWWAYAQLDQFTASFALVDSSMTQYLAQTYGYWFDHFVDRPLGEVWNRINASTQEPMDTLPKQWPWKNGYHSLEHALVGYITSSQLHGEPVVLHYGFEQLPELETIHPYYYRGEIEQITLTPSSDGFTMYTVTFSDVH